MVLIQGPLALMARVVPGDGDDTGRASVPLPGDPESRPNTDKGKPGPLGSWSTGVGTLSTVLCPPDPSTVDPSPLSTPENRVPGVTTSYIYSPRRPGPWTTSVHYSASAGPEPPRRKPRPSHSRGSGRDSRWTGRTTGTSTPPRRFHHPGPDSPSYR